MLNQAGLKKDMRGKLWAECAATATHLDNVIVRKDNTKYYRFHKKHPKIWKELRAFGEIVVMKNVTGFQSKLQNKGVTCMFLGYELNHPIGAYRLLNLTSFISTKENFCRDMR